MSRHTKERRLNVFSTLVAQFDGVFLLIERQRAVSPQLNADRSLIAARLHVGCHFLLRVQRGLCRDANLLHARSCFLFRLCQPR